MKTLAMVVRQWGLLAPLVWLVFSLPAAHAATCTGIPIAPGQSIQAAVDANPAGTTFCIQAGIHRLQQVTPKDGDRFIGEYGAILSGAKILPASSFVQSGSYWHIGGQTQGSFKSNVGQGRMESDAYLCEDYGEEVFVNGTTRLSHVCSLADLGPGKWHFDYTNDRIYLYDNPSSFSLIETSVTRGAFGGQGVNNVLVENLVVEKYTSDAGQGPIGGFGRGNTHTRNWTVRYVTSRYNHGAGISLGHGMTVENSKIHDNGQLGIGGPSGDPSGYVAPVTVRNNEVFRNKVLHYKWGWEGGGSKLVLSDGALVENNWFHDNIGPGIWFDISNRNSIIRSNLVENTNVSNKTQERGIFYEVNYGPASIYWNTVRDNKGEGILNSSSEQVEIYENVLINNPVHAQDAKRRPNVSTNAHHNDTSGKGANMGSIDGLADALTRHKFDHNTYRNVSANVGNWWAGTFWSCCSRTFSEWQGLGLDVNGRVTTGTPALPPGAVPFTLSQYGQQQTTGTTPTLAFTANPPSITAGQSSTLTWSSTNATSCTASNGWSGAKTTSGSEAVTPPTTTTYTLLCTGSGGSVTQSVTVTISPASGLRGDLDGDQDADLADLRLLIQMLVGQVPPDVTIADLDGDGQLNLGDVRALITILVGS